MRERRGNLADAWAWLCGYEGARAHLTGLFDDARIATVPMLVEHTADELNGLFGTLSFWSKLSREQRQTIERENRALYERLGRPIRSSILACALTARRREQAT